MSSKAIIGRKVGMTQLFAEDGKVIPVTVVPRSAGQNGRIGRLRCVETRVSSRKRTQPQ